MNISASILFPLFSIGLGILLIAIVGYLYFLSRNMDEWQVTQGIITKSSIKHAGATFSLHVQYQYSVLGTEYTGINAKITLKQTYKLKVAQDWATQYPVGKKVDVFYNPEKHRIAVLEKGFSVKSGLFQIGAALFLVIFGIFILFIEYH